MIALQEFQEHKWHAERRLESNVGEEKGKESNSLYRPEKYPYSSCLMVGLHPAVLISTG